MALAAGDRFGSYEVLSALGAGGMGEVYRARDTKLNREVALKILPGEFALDVDRLARFKREAQILAALSHPNIAGIHGLEEADSTLALVIELVDGPTLADRIAQGPIPITEALAIARQLTDALDAAHDQSIIHRDLKPANIKVRHDGIVKVLDFGLAKLAEPARSGMSVSAGLSQSPTITTPAMTQVGMILGTAAYMAPEQARGRPADKRSDVWAFGCVLFEMLTGTRAFPGEDIAETLAAVIKTEPDLSRTPREVRRLLRACFAKDPRQRLHSAGDAWLLLDQADSTAPTVSQGRPIRWIAATAALALLTLISTFWTLASRRTSANRPVVRLDVRLSPDAVPNNGGVIAISPDGTRVVFPVRGTDGKQRLATRALDQDSVTTLPGSEDAGAPFFSPDGQWVGFFTPGALKKIALQGGPAVTLAESATPRGATWTDDGAIIAGLRNSAGLMRIPDSGGTPVALTQLAPGEATHRWPQVVPGHNVVFTVSANVISYEQASIRGLSLQTGVSKTLVPDAYFGRYMKAANGLGYLLFLRERTLFAVPFDPNRLELRGAPFSLIDDVARGSGTGVGFFDASQTGTLAYARSLTADQAWPVVWLDSEGKTQPIIATPGSYDQPRLSPDGRRLAIQVSNGRSRDLYILDLERDTTSRLTFTGGGSPTWAPDNKHLAFSTQSQDANAGDARFEIYWTRADGSSQPERLLQSKNPVSPYSFSPDGRYLLLFDTTSDAGTNILILPLDVTDAEHPKPGQLEPYLKTPANELEASFSPDSRWIMYRSNESGMMEVYVRPFRGSGKWQISSGGAMHPRWSPAGRQLFYNTLGDSHVMVVDYAVQGDSITFGRPRLWTADRILAPSGAFNMDVGRDGQRLVVFPVPPNGDERLTHVTFLFNFDEEIRRRAPTR